MTAPLLHVEGAGQALHAAACSGRETTFTLDADFTVEAPASSA